MNILFVIDQYDNISNKISYSARTMANSLREIGHTVTILSTGKFENDKVVLPKGHSPFLLKRSSESNDLRFAKPEERIIKRAFKEQDIIHFFMPSKLGEVGVEMAKEMKIPVTATFSVNPELIAENLGFAGNNRVIKHIYNKYKDFYDEFNCISVPTLYLQNKLKNEYEYFAEVVEIPNSVSEEYSYKKMEKPDELKEKIVITMAGAIEKRNGQAEIIKALQQSQYKDYLHLIFAGDGDNKENIENLLNESKISYTIKVFDKKELIETLSYTDLFIDLLKDTNDEIACIQAMAIGNVPLISRNNEIVMTEFELDDRFIYDIKEEGSLANKVDYWIEHQTELRKYRLEFAKAMDRYRLKNCTNKFEEMLEKEFNKALQTF